MHFEIPWENIIDFHFKIGIYTDLVYTYPIDEVFWKNHQVDIDRLYQKERRNDKINRLVLRTNQSRGRVLMEAIYEIENWE